VGPVRAPERYGLRSFDRAWILPDKRLINRPNPGLWQVRTAPGQLFLTALDRTSPSAGPAVTASAFVPDLDHHRGSFVGRAFPRFLDAAGERVNVPAGLLAALSARLSRSVSGEDVMAYVAALLAHPVYTAHFHADLLTPGLRVPLTADAASFTDAVALGRRVLWLHTPTAGASPTPQRASGRRAARRPGRPAAGRHAHSRQSRRDAGGDGA